MINSPERNLKLAGLVTENENSLSVQCVTSNTLTASSVPEVTFLKYLKLSFEISFYILTTMSQLIKNYPQAKQIQTKR